MINYLQIIDLQNTSHDFVLTGRLSTQRRSQSEWVLQEVGWSKLPSESGPWRKAALTVVASQTLDEKGDTSLCL